MNILASGAELFARNTKTVSNYSMNCLWARFVSTAGFSWPRLRGLDPLGIALSRGYPAERINSLWIQYFPGGFVCDLVWMVSAVWMLDGSFGIRAWEENALWIVCTMVHENWKCENCIFNFFDSIILFCIVWFFLFSFCIWALSNDSIEISTYRLHNINIRLSSNYNFQKINWNFYIKKSILNTKMLFD